MKRLALLAGLLPGAALAHGGAVAHPHPHGVETLWIAVAAFLAGGVVAWALARRK
ncbi:hypothetical protein HMH01_10335 [Halovulum dunhuangense]|uniref:MYXO-CTERM domain-containing protein n=1 Tax=Halovulum dunhuangense TaxID=1505036 RepID=A0A849L3E5_9RHOB|nr:hypothetical protein [Halovulum dunhuangense]NNU80835.1 hypothetical protein [Halovulum dunhuangense]